MSIEKNIFYYIWCSYFTMKWLRESTFRSRTKPSTMWNIVINQWFFKNMIPYCYPLLRREPLCIKHLATWITIRIMEIYRDIIDFIVFLTRNFLNTGVKNIINRCLPTTYHILSLFTTWNPFPPGDRMIHNSDNDNIEYAFSEKLREWKLNALYTYPIIQ